MIEKKYLPIGTVVMLKNGTKRVMITGFCIIDSEHKDQIFDYLGCLYPEGMLDAKQGLMFNHDQIEKIHHMGLKDEEEQKFQLALKEVVKNFEIKKEENKSKPILEKL